MSTPVARDLSAHAATVLRERGIEMDWVGRAITDLRLNGDLLTVPNSTTSLNRKAPACCHVMVTADHDRIAPDPMPSNSTYSSEIELGRRQGGAGKGRQGAAHHQRRGVRLRQQPIAAALSRDADRDDEVLWRVPS
jgi:hypothetical protein